MPRRRATRRPGGRGPRSPDPGRVRGGDDVVSISCLDGPARKPSQSWPSVIPKLTDDEHPVRTAAGLVAVGAVRVELAGASADRYAGPWDATTKTRSS